MILQGILVILVLMCDISFNVLILSTILVVLCDIRFNVLMCNTSICCTTLVLM